MSDIVSYSLDGHVATLTMDDGKANALAPAMSEGLNAGLDRAEADGARCVVIRGRPGVLCGGFDLKIIRGDDEALRVHMRDLGWGVAFRIYMFPIPVIFACTGHSVAAGGILLLAGDVRIGVKGDYRIGLNETAIGLPMPVKGLELARDRLLPTELQHAAVMAKLYNPDEAARVGYLDEAVAAEDLDAAIASHAERLAALDMAAFAEVKKRMHRPTLERIAAGEAAE